MPVPIEELPIVGGHPALDLVNTVEPRAVEVPGGQHDNLLDPPTMLSWARRVGIVDDAEGRAIADAWERDPATAQAALDDAKQIREALYVAVLAAANLTTQDATQAAGALERLRDRWAAAISRSRLVLATPIKLAIGSTPANLVTDRLAEASIDLLRNVDYSRLRRCPPNEGGCGWIVLDRSRNGSRRWCQMSDCGAVVKARRLTERRRASRPAS